MRCRKAPPPTLGVEKLGDDREGEGKDEALGDASGVGAEEEDDEEAEADIEPRSKKTSTSAGVEFTAACKVDRRASQQRGVGCRQTVSGKIWGSSELN